MTDRAPLTDALFNGFVDGRLSARADREVSTVLAGDHGAAAKAATWRRQSEALRTAFAPIADEPLPLSLILKVRASLPDRQRGRTLMIAIAAFLTGLASGLILGWIALHG